MPVWMAIALIAAMLIAGGVGFVREQRKPRVDGDGRVLAELQKAGSDLRKIHSIEFFLLFRTPEGAQKAARELSEAGYAAQCDSVGAGNRWLCKATKSLVPELDALRQIRAQLTSLAARLGGEYDGWGTAIVK